MRMNLRLLGLTAALSLSGCLCSGPPSGECSGTWGGVTFDKLQVDPASKVTIVRKTTCTGTDLKRYDISWGESKVGLNLSFLTGGPTILGEVSHVLPPAVDRFLTFSVTPGTPPPSGELKLGIVGVQGRRTGTLSLSSGTEALTCSFEVPYVAEGPRLSCGGSGGSDFD